MSKSNIFLYLLISFLVGIFTRSFFDIGQNQILLLFVFSIIILFLFYKNLLATMVAFLICFFLVGAWRADESLRIVNAAIFAGKIFHEKAVVIKNTDGTFGQNLIVELQNEKIGLLIKVPPYPKFKYGDLLEVSCVAKIIENLPAGEEGKDAEFDYRMYMAKEGVLYECENKKYEKIAENKGNFLMSKIIHFRSLFETNIESVIPQPESSLAGGLLFGGSNKISKEIQNDFSKTGMTHIVAVSGYNVTIIAEYLILLGITLGLWRNQAIWFALIGITIFVIMSGLPASAVRAGVMSGVLLWAMKHGRIAQAENAIIFAAAIMLYLNPLLLRWDVGFQLSFLATLGIVICSPFWEKSFAKKHKALGISEEILLSLSAQIFVLPIIAYNFHITSLISLLANIFILPIIPISMLMVFLVSVSGFVFTAISIVFAWLSYLPLHYELWLIHLMAQFPWASISIKNFNEWWMILYYIFLSVLILLYKKFEEQNSKSETNST